MTEEGARIAARAKALVKDHVDLLERLVELRNERGLTVSTVARRMHLSEADVEKIERYDANPTLSDLRAYAHAVSALITTSVRPDDATLSEPKVTPAMSSSQGNWLFRVRQAQGAEKAAFGVPRSADWASYGDLERLINASRPLEAR